MRFVRFSILWVACWAAMPAFADLSAAKAERNLEKRSRKALENAEAALKAADEAYRTGELDKSQALLDEVGESVQLSHSSLKQTGKNPSRSPKHFKHAEIKTRELLRKLADFREQMSAGDRDQIDKVRESVQRIHEELLLGIMGKRR